jgi:hypothetical protein
VRASCCWVGGFGFAKIHFAPPGMATWIRQAGRLAGRPLCSLRSLRLGLERIKLVLRAGESQAQFIAKVIVREVERRERQRKPK